jgi:hypothetical protein
VYENIIDQMAKIFLELFKIKDELIYPKLRNSLFMSLTLLASLANFTLSCLFVSPIEREIAVKNQRFFLLRNLGLCKKERRKTALLF